MTKKQNHYELLEQLRATFHAWPHIQRRTRLREYDPIEKIIRQVELLHPYEKRNAGRPSLQEIKFWCDPYDTCRVECDGMTNILHYVLSHAGIAHEVYTGYVEYGPVGISWHMWLKIACREGIALVDYRARMWLGDDARVPHGVFLPVHFDEVQYVGEVTSLDVLPLPIIKFLVEGAY